MGADKYRAVAEISRHQSVVIRRYRCGVLTMGLAALRSFIAVLAATLTLSASQTVEATIVCRKWNTTSCSTGDWNNPQMKHIVVVPTGFGAADEATFFADFDRLIAEMSNAAGGTRSTFSVQHRDRIMFIADFRASEPLGSNALFGGALAAHPSAARGTILVLRNDDVYSRMTWLKANGLPKLRPFTVAVISIHSKIQLRTRRLRPT